jgi:hypothetical protein
MVGFLRRWPNRRVRRHVDFFRSGRAVGLRHKVNTSGFLAGLQLGYNWQVSPRWVAGVLADLSYLDSNGSFTCLQASPIIVGSNCEVSPRGLATVAGRIGFLVDPPGRALIYWQSRRCLDE